MGRVKGGKNTTFHIWSDEEKQYLKEITPGHHHHEILELMNKKFTHQFTIGQIKGAIKRYDLKTGFTGQFPKGNIPMNKGIKGVTYEGCKKTWFPKGNKSYNSVPIGTERINGDGYIDIKVADGKKQRNWRGKHVLIWENTNGPVPKGYNVIFGDRNNRNFDINNLILVSKKQLLKMNKNGLIKNNADLTRTGLMIAKVYIKISERAKE